MDRILWCISALLIFVALFCIAYYATDKILSSAKIEKADISPSKEVLNQLDETILNTIKSLSTSINVGYITPKYTTLFGDKLSPELLYLGPDTVIRLFLLGSTLYAEIEDGSAIETESPIVIESFKIVFTELMKYRVVPELERVR